MLRAFLNSSGEWHHMDAVNFKNNENETMCQCSPKMQVSEKVDLHAANITVLYEDKCSV